MIGRRPGDLTEMEVELARCLDGGFVHGARVRVFPEGPRDEDDIAGPREGTLVGLLQQEHCVVAVIMFDWVPMVLTARHVTRLELVKGKS